MRTLPALFLAALTADAAAQASWSTIYPSGSPLPRVNPSLVCFEPTGDVLMLFGLLGGQPVSQNWKLHANTWSVFPAPPFPAIVANLVYDSARQRIVAFGGDNSTNETWEWNGVQWFHPLPVVRPIARSECAIAFDRARGVTVVFGGSDTFGNFLQDVWEWNGTAWVQRAATAPFGPRVTARMAFDPVQQNVILHGGYAPLPPFPGTTIVTNDTWAWNGTAWTQHTPATPPAYGTLGAMVTDLHRQRVVLFGSTTGVATYEWDGSEWTAFVDPSLATRQLHGMAYDTSGRRVVLFGGLSASAMLVQDTWIYSTPLPADAVPFGTGCAGSAGIPQLGIAPYSLPWLGDTTRTVVRELAPSTPGVLFVMGAASFLPMSLAPIGAPGCDLLLQPDFLALEAASAGTADWTLSIPFSVALAGLSINQQAFPYEPAANPLGFIASNGLRLVLGIR